MADNPPFINERGIIKRGDERREGGQASPPVSEGEKKIGKKNKVRKKQRMIYHLVK